MKKIIVSGATSMIGKATLEVAATYGVEIYAIIRNNTQRKNRISNNSFVNIIYGDLDSLLETEGLPADADVFYHFAWSGTGREEREDPLIQEKNIDYTLKAVKLAKKCGCKRFVFAGSQAEYGTVEGIINENTKFAPFSPYGVAKYAAGSMSKKLCEDYGITHVWGRIFSVYGPHDKEGTMINYALDCFDLHKKAFFSESKQIWNYLYESDAGEIFFRLGDESIPQGVYLIASDVSKPLKEYIKDIINTYDYKIECVFEKSDKKVFDLNVNNSKTLELLNYLPKVKFSEGIHKTKIFRNNFF